MVARGMGRGGVGDAGMTDSEISWNAINGWWQWQTRYKLEWLGYGSPEVHLLNAGELVQSDNGGYAWSTSNAAIRHAYALAHPTS